MAKPADVFKQNTDSSVTSGSSLIFPSDLREVPYFCSMHFVRYVRPLDGPATFRPQGNMFFPLPHQIPENYSIRYDQRSLSVFGNDLKELTTVGQTLGGDIARSWDRMDKRGILEGKYSAYESFSRDAVGTYGKYLAALIPNWLRDGRWAAPVNRLTQALGAIQNPHMAVIFDGVNLRRHAFTWSFSPKSQRESEQLRTMINRLRRHAHPRFTPGMSRFTLDFPDQVYMNFVGSDFVYPIKRSVIESVTVDNAEGGQPIWYAGGAPVFIGLRIELSETEILTAADFDGQPTLDGTYAGPSTPFAPPTSTVGQSSYPTTGA